MESVTIICEFPEKYNAQPSNPGKMAILTPGGPRMANITGNMTHLGDRRWKVELQYSKNLGEEQADS